QLRGDVGSMQSRHDQHACRPGEAAEGIELLHQSVIQSHADLHFAVILKIRSASIQDRDRFADTHCPLSRWIAETGEGQESDARFMPHAAGEFRSLLSNV